MKDPDNSETGTPVRGSGIFLFRRFGERIEWGVEAPLRKLIFRHKLSEHPCLST
jgi:hypothetical protein